MKAEQEILTNLGMLRIPLASLS